MKELVPVAVKIERTLAAQIDTVRGSLSRSEWLRAAISDKLGVPLNLAAYDRAQSFSSIVAEEPAAFNAAPKKKEAPLTKTKTKS